MGNYGHLIGVPASLEQTAEELCEAAHACLKYARHMRNENDTHKNTEEIVNNFHEEIADVGAAIAELIDLGLIDMDSIYNVIEFKNKRMISRGVPSVQVCNILATDPDKLKEINKKLIEYDEK